MKVLGLIPARRGSKGVPDKNVMPLAGKSLVRRAYECGTESGALDRIVISTDDPLIAEESRAFGLEVPFLRPAELAGDESPMIDVAVHAIKALGEAGYRPDALLLLQPTSPLRSPGHIREAVGLLSDNDAVCSVVPVPKDLCPHYLMKVTEGGYLDYFMPGGGRFVRRQDVPQAYKRDGTIYLTRTSVILDSLSFYGERCVPFVIDPRESLNIDEPADWAEAERRLSASRP